MPVLYCTYCGESFPARRTNAKYCNRDCYDRARLQSAANNLSRKPATVYLDSCQFTEGVSCFPIGDCSKCGWNPAVAQKRLNQILAKMLGLEEVLTDGS